MTSPDLLHDVGQSLLAHRLRSTLAATGIVAGIATVVAALAIAGGSRRATMADIGALGTDVVIVRGHERTDAKGARLAPLLTLSDADAFRSRFPAALATAARLVHDSAAAGVRSVPAPLAGVTLGWFEANRLELARGRTFHAADAHALYAVIGDSLASTLFGVTDPIGQAIFAGGEWRTIIGVLASGAARPRSSLVILSADDAILVPFETLDLSLGAGDRGDAASEILVRLPSGDDPAIAAQTVARLLDARRDGNGPVVDILVPQELLRARLRAERGSQVLLLSIGVLALLISGVGIVNIMVASVTERAVEIGVRRAVGARRRAVLVLFASEALVLGAVGGIIGIPVGLAATVLSAHFGGWPVAVSGTSLATSLALAVGTALGAGLYPAYRAASVSPIEALRQ